MKLPFAYSSIATATLRRLFSITAASLSGTAQPQLVRVAAKPKVSKQKAGPGKGCPVCREGLQYFGYRDVLLLRQFLSPEGYIIGRRKTRICPKLQRRVAKCIKRARKEGLLPNFQAPPTAPPTG